MANNIPVQNIPILSPKQIGFTETALNQAQPLLQQLMGSKNNYAQAARENFNRQTVPSIAERFTGLGAQRSSAFPSILGQAGADLDRDIQLGMRQQDMDLLRLLLKAGMQPSFSPLGLPDEGMSFGQKLGGSALSVAESVLPAIIDAYLPGAGSGLKALFQQLFGQKNQGNVRGGGYLPGQSESLPSGMQLLLNQLGVGGGERQMSGMASAADLSNPMQLLLNRFGA